MKNYFPLTMVTVAFLFMASCGSKPITLTIQVTKGDKYECVTKIEAITNTMGIKMNQTIESKQTLIVENVLPSGNVVFKNSTDRFYIKQNMGGFPISMEYDSDKPKKSESMLGIDMGQYFSNMKNVSYEVELDKQGKLVRSSMKDAYKELGLDSLNQQGGNNTENNADQYIAQLPSNAIKEGDSYTAENKLSGMGNALVKNTYTVTEINEESVWMDVKTEFINGNGEVSENMKIKMSGNQSGTVEIDRKTGMTLKSNLKQNMKMTVEAGGKSVPMDVESTVMYTCTKK